MVPEARELIDSIELDLARRQLFTLDQLDLPERDCENCGERIVHTPVGPTPWEGGKAWIHLGTGAAECKDTPAAVAIPREDDQGSDGTDDHD